MEQVDGSAGQLIVVRWLWEQCHLVDGGRAFVVEIPTERARELLGSRANDETDAYLKGVATRASMHPGSVTEGHVTCIVAADGRVVDSYQDPWFPYSNLWNGYCPLRRLGIRVTELADLQSIPSDVVEKALKEDIPPSLGFLDIDSWYRTLIEGGHGTPTPSAE